MPDFDPERLLRIAQALNERTERTIAHQTQTIRPGLVLETYQEIGLAQVLLDGEIGPINCRWLGLVGPDVQVRVHVLLSGGDATIVAGLPVDMVPDPPPPPEPPPAPDVEGFGRLTLWGHSWTDITTGNTGGIRPRTARFGDRLAGIMGIDWPNYHSNGHYSDAMLRLGIAAGGFSAMQQKVRPENANAAPYVATHGHHLIVTGLNDVAIFGPFTSQIVDAWRHIWRGTIARLWAGGVFECTDPSWHFNGTWSPPATPSFWASGRAYVIGNYVSYNNQTYVAIQAGTNHQPNTSPTFWTPQAIPIGPPWLWDLATTYAIGNYVIQTVSSVTTTYQAIQAGINHPPNTSPTFWSPHPNIIGCPWDTNRLLRGTYTAGDYATWTVPADFPGGHVNIRLVGEVQGGQAGATVVTIAAPSTVTGGAAQVFTLSTHNAMPAGVNHSMLNQRIALPKTGLPQEITITATTLASGGRLVVDCAEIEDPVPPCIVGLSVAKPLSWHAYGDLVVSTTPRSGSTAPLGAQTEDDWAAVANAATDQVFAEYGMPSLLLDADPFMDGTVYPERYTDYVHPNALGDQYIARAVADAFATIRTLFSTNVVTTHDPEALALWSLFTGISS